MTPRTISRAWSGWALIALLSASGCGPKDVSVAGGTSTETEAQIVGAFTNPDGSAAVGARVHIRPVGYLSETSLDTLTREDLITDSLGRVSWATKDTGLFNLEATLGDTLGALIRNISPGKEAENLHGVLDTAGALRVNLLSPPSGIAYTLRVYGLERYASADSQGSFRVTLPAGDYRLVITGFPATVTPILIENAHVDRGKINLIDSMRFPRLDSALLGYWPLEEGSGAIVGDGSGNGHIGKLKGAQWVPGKIGGALKFTMGQGYVDLGVASPDVFNFGSSADFSFAAWTKVGNPVPNRGLARRIISRQKNSGNSFFLRVFPDGRPGFAANAVAGGSKIAATQAVGARDLLAPINIADHAWHHLVGVRRSGRLILYVDGKEMASAMVDSLKTDFSFTDYKDSTPVLYPDPGTDGHLMIGCVNSGQDGYDGLIDEVRIYGRSLTPQEVLQLAGPVTP